MDNQKALSISLLNEMLTTYQSTRQFAMYKLNYLQPCCPTSIHEIEEFTKMQDTANFKIIKISGCITWLSQLETDT